MDFVADDPEEPERSLDRFAEALRLWGLALPPFELDSEDERVLLYELLPGSGDLPANVRGEGFASPRPIRRELRAFFDETGRPVADAALVERMLEERGVRLDSQGRDRRVQAADGDPALFTAELTEDEALDAVEEQPYLEGHGYFNPEISP